MESSAAAASSRVGNPVFPGWYADPEGIIFDDKYWIYPTYSDHYNDGNEGEDTSCSDEQSILTPEQQAMQKNTINQQYLMQTFFDAFSSTDLSSWTKHSHILDVKDVKWASYAMWAPTIVKKGNQYYLFFSANDIQNDKQLGGIGVAVSDNPGGPFVDALGKPLIDKFHNGAQPIDQFVFKDDSDGKYYMYYGGWGHCNVVRLSDDLLSVVPHEDGTIYKEITPEHYVEAPFLFKRNGRYYFMWSEGSWGGPHYSVAYAVADSPLGPFKRIDKILKQDPEVGKGAGHHSIINIPGSDDEWFVIYHRRPLDTDKNIHRETCIDVMTFNEKGLINPVKITKEGVKRRPLP